MTRQLIDLSARPLLDIVSHGRGSRGERLPLSRAQIDQIARTVRRVPEVMIKVLPKDSNNATSIRNHIDYIARRGKLELEGDDGGCMSGKKLGERILEDWDLDLEAHRRESEFKSTRGRPAAKIVHKLIFSMPPGTLAQGVLAAVHDFAREEFALKHRYAMALHTDEPHPHVHLVIKAVSEHGERLTIGKGTLRTWREQFARHLRAHGIAANATERAVRGQRQTATKDGIYRASLRGDSTYVRAEAEGVARELLKGGLCVEPGKKTLMETRKHVVRGWQAIEAQLSAAGHRELAGDIQRFVRDMPPPLTQRDWMAHTLRQHLLQPSVCERPQAR